VNNKSLITDGITRLVVAIKGQKLPAKFFVTPNIDEVILGWDWLTSNGIIWDFSSQCISVGDQELRLRSKSGCYRITVLRSVTVLS